MIPNVIFYFRDKTIEFCNVVICAPVLECSAVCARLCV